MSLARAPCAEAGPRQGKTAFREVRKAVTSSFTGSWTTRLAGGEAADRPAGRIL